MKHTDHKGHHEDPGFLPEERIKEHFTKYSAFTGKPLPFEKWLDPNFHHKMVYSHHDRIHGGKIVIYQLMNGLNGY